MARVWTSERRAILRDLRLKQYTYSEIAEILGVGFTKNSCIGEARRLGIAQETAKPQCKTKRVRASKPKKPPKPKPDYTKKPARLATSTNERVVASQRQGIVNNKIRRQNGKHADPLGISLLGFAPKPPPKAARRPGVCQWIDGEPTDDESCKCGAPTNGGSWCDEHLPRIWIPGSARDNREPIYVPHSWR